MFLRRVVNYANRFFSFYIYTKKTIAYEVDYVVVYTRKSHHLVANNVTTLFLHQYSKVTVRIALTYFINMQNVTLKPPFFFLALFLRPAAFYTYLLRKLNLI